MSAPLLHLIGRIVFGLVTIGLLLFSLYPFWRDRRSSAKGRRENPKIVISLALFLGTILAAGTAQAFVHFVQKPTYRVPAVEGILLGLWASATYATLGLRDIRRRQWQYGRGRAYLTLGLVLVCLGAVGGFAYLVKVKAFSPTLFTSTRFNFRFNANPPWEQVDATTLDARAILALKREKPAMFFTLVAEALPAGSTLTNKELANSAKDRLEKSSQQFELVGEAPLALDGIAGELLESSAAVQKQPLRYVQWVSVSMGFSYQLTVWSGQLVEREALKREALNLFKHFDLLRNANTPEPVTTKAMDYHSLTSGFSVKLVDTPWKEPVHDLYNSFPSAEFGVGCQMGNGVLAVIPLPLGNLDPNIEILTHVFLWRIGVESMAESVYGLKEITHGPLSGCSFNFERMSLPGTLYRAEVLKGNGFAYLVIAYMDKVGEANKKLADAIGRVEFDPAPPQPNVNNFTTREREIRAIYLREIGQACLTRNEYQDASRYFELARALTPQLFKYALDAAESMIRAGDLTAACAYVKSRVQGYIQPGVSAPSALLVRLGWLQQQTGDTSGAVQSYASAFEDPEFQDDGSFSDYLLLLQKLGRADTALEIAAKYLKRYQSWEVQAAEADVYLREQKSSEAIKILTELYHSHPENSAISIKLAGAHIVAKSYKESLEVCEQLIKNGCGTAVVHYLKGRTEMGLKDFKAAKESLQAALRQEPENLSVERLLQEVAAEEAHPEAVLTSGTQAAP